MLRFDNAKDEELKKNLLLSELLLKYDIMKKFKVDIESIEIKYTKEGKPYIDGFLNYNFSISHSKEIIVLAISSKNEIGVDIEKITEIEEAIINRFITDIYPSKNNSIDNLSVNYIEFIYYWTRFESYTKYLGYGLSSRIKKDINLEEYCKTFKYNDYFLSIYSPEEGIPEFYELNIATLYDFYKQVLL